MELKIGQYWHRKEDGAEILVKNETYTGLFECEYTKETNSTPLGYIRYWCIIGLLNCGYSIGKCPT